MAHLFEIYLLIYCNTYMHCEILIAKYSDDRSLGWISTIHQQLVLFFLSRMRTSKIIFIATKFIAVLRFKFFHTGDEFSLYNLCMFQIEIVKNFQ